MKKYKFEHVRVSMVSVYEITRSPENDKLYRPVQKDDPEIIALAASIKERGIIEAIIITKEGYIVSGHRRYAAARLAGLKVLPCKRLRISRKHPGFLSLLREANLQRVKSREEQLREETVAANPEEAYESLIAHREEKARVKIAPMELRGRRWRCEISAAKKPFLDAVLEIIERLRPFWPLSDRQIHYQLLNLKVLIHAAKPLSRYRNDRSSYAALSDLLTRARHEGSISYTVIADATRPVTLFEGYSNTGVFIRDQLETMGKGYWRDLMQSQTNHFEIFAEKLTLQGILAPVAAKYCIPLTIGRGYVSTRPKFDLAERFKRSGKRRLVLFILADFDPDGDEIAHSLVTSLRDDFGIAEIHPVRVALEPRHIRELQLPPSMLMAKVKSANYKRFFAKHRSARVYELEAVDPRTLQRLLQEAIDSEIDIAAFNAELDQEKLDSAHLENVRRRMLVALRELDMGEDVEPSN